MEPLGWGQIFAQVVAQFLPVWVALLILFALSIRFKRRLALYGKLFDSVMGMCGFFLVMFWLFTALFAQGVELGGATLIPSIATFDPLAQIAAMKNKVPGTFIPDSETTAYLLGGDNLGRDVFSRMVVGAQKVMSIAPAATAFAFMVGVTLGLPAGYFGGRFDTILSFVANLVLAFPVILLFYLLVTPEIRKAGTEIPIWLGNTWTTSIPNILAAVLFLFPVAFFVILWNSRFHTQPGKRTLLIVLTVLLGLWGYSGLAFNADPLGLFGMSPNLLNVFVSVVFVNSPTVFRIVRGITLDIQTRDYVAAAQTRGEGPWYIMLWEILPNARGPLIVDFCLRIGYTTILLGTLGFFGLGVSPESPDWGSTINDGRKLLSIYPHPALPPAIALMSLVLGLNLLADGLREESLKD
ncbi:MAG: ABC transporter permease [Rhodobacteraceae bacterium]|nr:ABC transporter permease [Paracoccaceae bacterium]